MTDFRASTSQSTTSEQSPSTVGTWLVANLMQNNPRLLARFIKFRDQLSSLSRRKRRWLARRSAVSLAGVALLLALSRAAVGAGTINVDPGAVEIAADGRCSLIEAITNANDDAQTYFDCASGAGIDTINLPGGTFTLSNPSGNYYQSDTGLPKIEGNIVISGNGSIIARDEAAPPFRIMAVGSGGDLTLRNMTLSHGKVVEATRPDRGKGGAIYNNGLLTLEQVSLGANYAPVGEGYGGGLYASPTSTTSIRSSDVLNNEAEIGGGLASSGILLVHDSTISGNTAGTSAALFSRGTTTIEGSTISNNSSYNSGGAVLIMTPLGSESSVLDSTITGNYSYSFGGGVAAWGRGALTIDGSTIADNTLYDGFGGGVFVDQSLDVTIKNSSINDNEVLFGSGGGLGFGRDATVTVINSTISGNAASTGGGIYSHNSLVTLVNSTIVHNEASIRGGGVANQWGVVSVKASIVSGNSSSLGAEVYTDSTTTVTEADSYNVFGRETVSHADAFVNFLPGSRDLDATSDGGTPYAIEAILDTTLSDNGGPTSTHALVLGSPAIDAVPVLACDQTVDQRGVTRPQGPACDVGAFEFVPSADDGDGVDDAIEDGAPNNGDGNYDGIPDSEQPNVASLPNAANGDYLTIEVPEGTVLQDVTSLGDVSPGNAPPNVLFPLGYLSFQLSNLDIGQAVSINLYLENPETINRYFKYGPTLNTPVDHWYSFTYNGETGVEVIAPDRLTLHFVDGKRGDSDLTANGIIIDPGGPAFAISPPVVDAGTGYEGEEGSSISLDGASAIDAEGDTLAYKWSVDSPLCTFSDDSLLTPEITCQDNGSFTATLTVSDGVNDSVSSAAAISVINVAPAISSLASPTTLVDISNQAFAVTINYSDPGTADTHAVTWDWGDGTTDTQLNATSPAVRGHVYNLPGVYTVKVTVTDDDGGSDTKAFEYIVVFDPDGGFVTGGGWINSPAGAYVTEPELTGKANFGFVSKYKKGANVPTGNTEFQFKAGNLNFRSDSYDWLVVAGAKAKFKGTGTINGSGNYGFMLSAIDAAQTPSTDTDLFRVKIWDKNDGDAVIYDNQLGDGEDADPTTAIGGGNIMVHQSK